MASLDMLLESLKSDEKKTRRVPDRTISGDTLDSIKNHRRNNYKAPPSPLNAGGVRRTNMSRRGARRPSKSGNGGSSALETFVESMNESQRSMNEEDKDPAEDTVDSRQLVGDKMPQLRAKTAKKANRVIEEDDDEDEDTTGDGDE